MLIFTSDLRQTLHFCYVNKTRQTSSALRASGSKQLSDVCVYFPIFGHFRLVGCISLGLSRECSLILIPTQVSHAPMSCCSLTRAEPRQFTVSQSQLLPSGQKMCCFFSHLRNQVTQIYSTELRADSTLTNEHKLWVKA